LLRDRLGDRFATMNPNGASAPEDAVEWDGELIADITPDVMKCLAQRKL
jgi:hypothetical protein